MIFRLTYRNSSEVPLEKKEKGHSPKHAYTHRARAHTHTHTHKSLKETNLPLQIEQICGIGLLPITPLERVTYMTLFYDPFLFFSSTI